MEEKKFDLNSIIGFVLIGIVLIWVLYNNTPTDQEIQAEKARQEQVQAESEASQNNVLTEQTPKVNLQDSTALAAYKGSLGSFAYSASLPSATEKVTTFENDKVRFKVSNKGGQIVEVLLKNFNRYDSVPVYLVEKENASFNLTFSTTDNRTLNTQDLFFEPTLTKNGDTQVLSMKLKASNNQYLEYRYELKPGE